MKKNKILIISILVIMCFSLVYLAYVFLNSKEAPKTIVNKYYSYEKNLNKEEAINLLENYDKNKSENKTDQDVLKKYMNKFSWNVENQDINGDKATVKVRINKIDMKEIYTKIFTLSFSNAFDNNKTDEQKDKESTTLLNTELDKTDLKMLDEIYTINLIKKDSTWKIVSDDNLSKSLNNIADVGETTMTTNNTYDPEIAKEKINVTSQFGEDGKDVVIIKNNNDVDIYDFEIEALFYDKDDNLLGSSKRVLDIFEKGQESATKFDDTPSNSEKVKFNIRLGKSTYYESHLSEMKLVHNNTGKQIVIQITNNSTKKIEMLPLGVVFYKNGEIVGYSDYEEYDLTSGDTATINISYPYDKSFDDVKFDDYKVFIKEAVCKK